MKYLVIISDTQDFEIVVLASNPEAADAAARLAFAEDRTSVKPMVRSIKCWPVALEEPPAPVEKASQEKT